VSDIDTAVVDSLKVLDLKWPIREADIRVVPANVRFQNRTSGGLSMNLMKRNSGIKKVSNND
jgi:hypothetical protein